MSFDPEGSVGKRIKPVLVQELINRYNIPDEADDVAEYILVLIAGNKTPLEIADEVKEFLNSPIDEQFVQSLFAEIKKYMDEESQATAQQVITEQPLPSQHEETKMEDIREPNVDFKAQFPPHGPKGMDRHSQQANSKFGRGGIGKNRGNTNQRKSYGMQNSANFEKALSMGGENVKQFVARAPKGRCVNFPGCPNRDCQFAHPTRTCFAYPNCPNPPGTCNYLHPSEDGELMAKLEVSKKAYMEKRSRPVEAAGTIGICKFGALCSKDICPFGHPTPANIEAKVMELVWCEAGKQCQDNTCRKAHPSPGYLAPPPEPKQPKPKPEKILEQCKYGSACTNFKCPRRHATTPVACREGANCQRLDCFFSHPIDEECRFGANCTNRTCMYKHPEGRATPSNTWVKNTSERPFAIADDQIMERAESMV